jgi:hypothetical protein
MGIVDLRPTGSRRAAVVAALSFAALAAGCSTDRFFGSEQPSASPPAANSPSIGSRVADAFSQKPTEPTPGEKQAAVTSVAESTCPPVDVRAGASTLTVPPNNTDALALRYQGTFGQVARECSVAGGIMRIKIGIEGRVLVGPAGGPGQVEIPLRYAVVREGPEPKTVVSKFSKVAVAIPEDRQNVLFTHVDNDVAFPMPPGLDIEAYVVYVGFDPIGEKQQPAKKPQAKPIRR